MPTPLSVQPCAVHGRIGRQALHPSLPWANTVVDDADQLAVDMSNGASAIKGKGAGSAFGALVYALPVRTPRTSP